MLTDHRSDPARDLRPHLPGRNSPHTARRSDCGGDVAMAFNSVQSTQGNADR